MSEERFVTIYQQDKPLPIKKREDLELLQLVMLDDIAISLREVEKHLEKEEFEGRTDSRILSATDEWQFIDLLNKTPHTPWISTFVINRGPDTVKLGINRPYDLLEIKPNETRTIDHAHADKRIEILYYKCDPGCTALVTLEGQY
jgi:hypothetical protein